MSISRKLLVGAVLLSAVPAVLVALLSAHLGGSRGLSAMEAQARQQLISIREAKRMQIESYFGRIHEQVRSLAFSPVTQNAMSGFSAVYPSNAVTDTAGRERLEDYYEDAFGARYLQKNAGHPADIPKIFSALDATALAMQIAYIADNPNPLGEKHWLDSADPGSAYGVIHARFHPFYRDYLERFGFYDIFLVEPTEGRVIYSVFKELDYGTRLTEGPYRESDLGKAFRTARGLQAGEIYQTDYRPYLPSYDDEAAFVASPIYRGEQLLGVLIFQIPIDGINTVMTSNGRWPDIGLGKSGETYLVGPDKTLRTASRFRIEDFAGYVQSLRDAGVAAKILDTIAAKSSGIGLQPVNTEGVDRALAGETGFSAFDDYRGVPVLSAFTPASIEGLSWVLMSEIDMSEALGPAYALRRAISVTALASATVLVLLGAGVGLWFARSLSRPLQNLRRTVKEIGESADLTRQITVTRQDEVGEIGAAINEMLGRFAEALRQINTSSEALTGSSAALSAVTEQTRHALEQQQSETDQMATAMEEMAATAQEVASNTAHASAAAQAAKAAMHDGTGVVSRAVDSINELAREVESAASVIAQLKEDSEAIGGVLDVIRNVAEQTNLLALNAAIEAARAGEAGRGFAVVADEVQVLASRTQQSTEEIQRMIERVQTGAEGASRAMQTSQKQAASGVLHASSVHEALDRIGSAIDRIDEMSHQIASAAEEQNAVSADVARSVSAVAESGRQSSDSSAETARASESLAALARRLKDLVSQFRV